MDPKNHAVFNNVAWKSTKVEQTEEHDRVLLRFCHPKSPKTMALPYACALALVCLASLLMPPNGALGEELQLQQYPEPRVASWFTNFGHINKYVEKIFNSSLKKFKQHKEPANTTKSPPSNTTNYLSLNTTNPPPRTTRTRQALESQRPQP